MLFITTAACATLTVSSHIEREANFTDYVTWDWGPPDNLPVGDPRLDNNPFFRDYVEGTVEKILVRKGYERAVTGLPDLLIHYHANVNQKVDVYKADYPYGYCYGNCEARVVEFEQGTIVLDIVDSATNKVVWRGWVQDTMDGVIDDQQRLRGQVFDGIAKMMLRLPNGGAALR
jgi:hypothetical protein